MKPNLCVRHASPADIAAVVRLKTDFARALGVPHTVNASEHDWSRDLFGTRALFSVLLAERGGTSAGILIYADRYCPGWTGALILVHDLYVAPEHRRQGVATALLQALARHAVERGIPGIELNVGAGNPASRLYAGVGFEHLQYCHTYMVAGPALRQLAGLTPQAAGMG